MKLIKGNFTTKGVNLFQNSMIFDTNLEELLSLKKHLLILVVADMSRSAMDGV